MQFQLDSKPILTSAIKKNLFSLILIQLAAASMNFDNLIQNELSLSVYPVSLDFNLMTLTAITKLRNSMHEIHLIEAVCDVGRSQT